MKNSLTERSMTEVQWNISGENDTRASIVDSRCALLQISRRVSALSSTSNYSKRLLPLHTTMIKIKRPRKGESTIILLQHCQWKISRQLIKSDETNYQRQSNIPPKSRMQCLFQAVPPPTNFGSFARTCCVFCVVLNTRVLRHDIWFTLFTP